MQQNSLHCLLLVVPHCIALSLPFKSNTLQQWANYISPTALQTAACTIISMSWSSLRWKTITVSGAKCKVLIFGLPSSALHHYIALRFTHAPLHHAPYTMRCCTAHIVVSLVPISGGSSSSLSTLSMRTVLLFTCVMWTEIRKTFSCQL